jgi:hypothetical protein
MRSLQTLRPSLVCLALAVASSALHCTAAGPDPHASNGVDGPSSGAARSDAGSNNTTGQGAGSGSSGGATSSGGVGSSGSGGRGLGSGGGATVQFVMQGVR